MQSAGERYATPLKNSTPSGPNNSTTRQYNLNLSCTNLSHQLGEYFFVSLLACAPIELFGGGKLGGRARDYGCLQREGAPKTPEIGVAYRLHR